MRAAELSPAAPIALFDSGAGGISVLREVRKVLPCEHFFYFGDTANAPYGARSRQEILELVLGHAERLLGFCKALVLACNTATAVAADELRRRYRDRIIVGIEPAVRPAVQSAPHPLVLVLATEVTLAEPRFLQLLADCEGEATILPLAAPGIVPLVEAGRGDSSEMDAYLAGLFADLPQKPDAVVLGCTHFPLAKAAIMRALGGDVRLFDGAAGTARRLGFLLEQQGLLRRSGQTGRVFVTSSQKEALPLYRQLLEEP